MADPYRDLTDDQITTKEAESKRIMREAIKLAQQINERAESRSATQESLTKDEIVARGLLHLYKTISQAGEQATLAARSDHGDQGSNCDYFINTQLKMNVGDIGD